MSSPGTLRFGQVATTPSPPPVGYDLIYVKTDDVLYIQDSFGVEVALGSASAITSLTGEVTASGPGAAVATVSNSAVIGKVLTGFTPGPNSTVLATDTILQAFQKLQAQVSATMAAAITQLNGDVSAVGPGNVTATVNSVGGSSAANIHSAEVAANAATPSNIASTIVERDASGNFAANNITSSLTGNVLGNLTGNVTGNVSGSSSTFTSALNGDVTGNQTTTTVVKIQGTPVNSTAPTDAQFLIYNSTGAQWFPQSISNDILITHSGVATIQPNVVTNSKLAQMPANTVKANKTGLTANATDSALGTLTESVSSILTLTGWTDATLGSPTIQVTLADATHSGYLSSTDWNTFSSTSAAAISALIGDVVATGPGSAAATIQPNVVSNSKLAQMGANTVKANVTGSTANASDVGLGTLTETTSSVLTLSGWTDATIGSPTITVKLAGASQSGYLSSADWNTFHSTSTSAITALTGDATATGPGSVAITLATVNSNVGTFGTALIIPSITVNAKGLITAVSTNTIAGLTNSNLSGSAGITGANIATNTVTNNNLAQMPANTVKANITATPATPVDVSLGTVTEATSSVLTLVGWSDATIGSPTIQVKQSTTSQSGYLSSTDWNTFNNKQPAGNYITALTGDVTAAGPGSAVATISVGAVTDTKGSLSNKPAVTVVATTNQALTGTPTIDGQATTAGTSLVLATAQTTASQNGPWLVQSGAWTRPTWFPSGGTTQAFQFITMLVRLGTVYQGSTWRMTTAGAVTIDTTSTTWAVTPQAGNYRADYTIGTQAGTSAVSLAFANSSKAILSWNPTANFTLLMPPTLPLAGQYLATADGAGTLQWTNPLVNIDGGAPNSNYTSGQVINGGTP